MAKLGVIASNINVVNPATNDLPASVKGTVKVKIFELEVKRIGVEVQRLHYMIQNLQEILQSALESDRALQQWQSYVVFKEREGSLIELRAALNSMLEQSSSLKLSKFDKLFCPIKTRRLYRDIEIVFGRINQDLSILDIDITSVTSPVQVRLITVARLITSATI